MCGITGFFCRNGIKSHLSEFVTSNRVIEHRGPDGQGLCFFNHREKEKNVSFYAADYNIEIPDDATLGLGHRRLSVLDLSSNGRQPMTIPDEKIWITFNGEIYNYLELRQELEQLGHVFYSNTDTEVVLHAYQAWGADCVIRFLGMWAFAIVDFNENIIFCSRDRFGIKPFYYFFDGSYFIFGSEIKQLLCFPFVGRKANERAIYDYLYFGGVDYCEETFFSNILKLMQGHNLLFDMNDHSIVVKQYYAPEFRINYDITPAEAAKKFKSMMFEIVRLHLRSDVDVGSCLSGGLDSSTLVCIMHKLLAEEGKNNIQQTFSSHFEEKEANEIEYMHEVIHATGVNAHFTYPKLDNFCQDIKKIVWHQDEPFGSTSIFAQWSVFKLVHQHGVKVMLDGQGADEQLAGYLSLRPMYFQELLAKKQYIQYAMELCWLLYHDRTISNWVNIPGKVGRCITKIVGAGRKLPEYNWLQKSFVEEHAGQSLYLACNKYKLFKDHESFSNLLYQLTFHTNIQSLLHYEDRNSMAFSVESRVPFLDHRLVEFVFSLPSTLKIRQGYTKRVLRDAMEGIIPDKIRFRKSKLGFATPERDWQKSILKPMIANALADERIRRFIHPERAQKYQAALEEMNGQDSSAWRWINLHLWMEAYDVR